MTQWRNCIVTLIDVIGIKQLALNGTSQATDLMRKLQSITESRMNYGMKAHAHAYMWNDSVLLLGYLDQATARSLLEEADSLKRAIEQGVNKCYAISVKGQTFPEPGFPSGAVFNGQIAEQPRSIVIKASSFAFANCFQIEALLGPRHKTDWYVDGRLKDAIEKEPKVVDSIDLLPGGESREVLMFNGSLY